MDCDNFYFGASIVLILVVVAIKMLALNGTSSSPSASPSPSGMKSMKTRTSPSPTPLPNNFLTLKNTSWVYKEDGSRVTFTDQPASGDEQGQYKAILSNQGIMIGFSYDNNQIYGPLVGDRWMRGLGQTLVKNNPKFGDHIVVFMKDDNTN